MMIYFSPSRPTPARRADMSYEDAIATTVTKAQALSEVRGHGCDVAEFFADCGDKSTYAGSDVLAWLGY